MARSNNGNSTSYFQITPDVATQKATGAPLTVSCWFRPAVLAQTSNLAFMVQSAGAYFGVLWDGANAYGTGQKVIVDNGIVNPGTSTAIASTTSWSHICGSRDGVSNNMSVYLNGGGKGTGAGGPNPANSLADNICMGVFKTNSGGVFSNMNGDLAEVAWWDVQLTDAEVASLAAGASPLLIQPNKLFLYYPMYSWGGIAGGTAMESLVKKQQTTPLVESGTMFNLTQHPPVFNFNSVGFEPQGAAAAVSASLVVSPMQTLLNQLLAR